MSKNTFSPFSIPTKRDLRIFQLAPDEVMVIGCDSSGGIGPKPLDKLKVDGYIVGKFTTRVALMEVISTGAKPVCVVDNLCVELKPTGLEILRGVRDEAIQAGLDPKLAVTGSAEKNFAVEQTGIGVTVIGISEKSSLRIGVSRAEDALVSLGNPCVGREVLPSEKKHSICDIADLLKLLSLDFVHEVIPVGSEGVKCEVKVLAESSNLKFKENISCPIDIGKSAGPATVLLASMPVSKLPVVERLFNKPISLVGTLV